MVAMHCLAVQPFMTPADYASPAAFFAKLDRLLGRARRQVGGDGAALAVLPEHLATFLALATVGPELGRVQSLDQAMARLAVRHAGALAATMARHRVGPRTALWHLLAPAVWAAWHRTAVELARRHRLFLVAGSALLPANRRGWQDDRFVAGGRAVYNLAITVDPAGHTLAVHKKSNLVPTLEDRLGLTAGRPEDLPVIELATAAGPVAMATAICYDGFAVPHTRREPNFRPALPMLDQRGARLVAVPSANPWPWEERWPLGEGGDCRTRAAQWVEEGPPAALARCRTVELVINPLLLLELWDVHFDGRSAIWRRGPDGVRAVAQAPDGRPQSSAECVVHYCWEPDPALS